MRGPPLLALVLTVLVIGLLCEFARPMEGPALSPQRIETVEEASETLANDLIDLAQGLRAGRVEGSTFAERVETAPFPAALPATPDALPDGIRSGKWTAPPASAQAAPEVIANLLAFRNSLSTVEDFRLKVKESALEHGDLVSRVQVQMFGRDPQGRRTWVRGFLRVAATRTPQGWRIHRFAPEGLALLATERDLFTDVTAEAGLVVEDARRDTRKGPLFGDDLRFHGQGAAAADVDGDGRLDLYVVDSPTCRLYLNAGGGRFREVAARAGVDRPGPAGLVPHGPLFVDYDDDGDADLFVAGVGRQALLENRRVPDGALTFRDVSERAGVAVEAIGTSATAGDVNGDGKVDLYVAGYQRHDLDVEPDSWLGATNGSPNLLFLNQGGGRFREAAKAWGCAGNAWSFAAVIADLDEDGRQDILVANDFGGGVNLYRNLGDRFEDVAASAGLTEDSYSMGLSLGDPDRDGDLDVHVTNMSSTAGNRILKHFPGAGDEGLFARIKRAVAGNSLYENLGEGRFRPTAGPFPGGWAWGGGFLDLDMDGREDLYTPNGYFTNTRMADT